MSDGVTRVAFNGFEFVEPAESTGSIPTAPAPTPAVQVNPDASQITRTSTSDNGDTSASSDGVTRLTSQELFETSAKEISAVNAHGRAIAQSEWTPSSIVTVPTADGLCTTTLAAALQANILKQDASGQYVVSNGERSAENEAPTEDTTREAFKNPDHEAALTTLATTLPTGLQQQLVNHFVLGKEITQTDLDNFAAASGLSREAFVHTMQTALNGFVEQANSAAQSMGITEAGLPALYNWMNAPAQKKDFQDVKLKMGLGGGTKEFKALVDRYFKTNLPPEKALIEAGYKLGKAGDGTTTVLIDGVPVSLAVAAREGMI